MYYKHKLNGYYGRILKSFDKDKRLGVSSNFQLDFLEIDENGDINGDPKILEMDNEFISDFLGFGERVVVLTDGNKLIFYDIGGEEVNLISSRSLNEDAEDNSNKENKGHSLTICSKKKYIFSSEIDEDWKPSRIRVFEVEMDNLVLLSSLDIGGIGTEFFRSFSFFGYFGNSLIFLGCEWSFNPKMVIFKFDLERGVIEELEGGRSVFDVGYVYGFVWRGNGRVCAVSEDNQLVEVEGVI